MARPYRILVTSNKGGTGRTTTTLGLAWAMGALGMETELVDLNPIPCLHYIAETPSGQCLWPRVTVTQQLGSNNKADVQLIDALPIGEIETNALLPEVDGVVLNCQAEILSLSVLDQALQKLIQVKGSLERPRLLGLIIQRFHKESLLEQKLSQRLEKMVPGLIHGIIEESDVLAHWPLLNGAIFNDLALQKAFRNAAENLKAQIDIRPKPEPVLAHSNRVSLSRSSLHSPNNRTPSSELNSNVNSEASALSEFFDQGRAVTKAKNPPMDAGVETQKVSGASVLASAKVVTSLDTISIPRQTKVEARPEFNVGPSLPNFHESTYRLPSEVSEQKGLFSKLKRLFFRSSSN